MKRGIESALDDCIARIRGGEALESCLESYPAIADELRSLLAASLVLKNVESHPDYLAMARGRRHFFQAAARKRAHINRRILGFPMRYAAQFAAGLTAAVVAGAAALAALTFVAWQADPGDDLYTARLTLEDVRLRWPLYDDQERSDLVLGYVERRYSELGELLRKGEPVEGEVLAALEDDIHDLLEFLPADGYDSGAEVTRLSSRGENLLVHSVDAIASDERSQFLRTLSAVHAARLYEQDPAAARAYLEKGSLYRGITRVVGELAPAQDGNMSVGGVSMIVDAGSLVLSEPGPRATAVAIAALEDDGLLHALTVTGDQRDGSEEVFVSGQVDSYLNRVLVVNGQRVLVADESVVIGAVRLGSSVEVTAQRDSQGLLVADVARVVDPALAANSFVYEGTLEAIGDPADSLLWRVGGQRFSVASLTLIDGRLSPLTVGAYTRVEATTVEGQLSARRLHVITAPDDRTYVRLRGRIDGVGEDNTVFINGIPVRVDPQIALSLKDGLVADVEGTWDGSHLISVPDRAVFLDEAPGGRFVVEGLVTALDEGGALEIGAFSAALTQDTVLRGTPAVGARVSVQALLTDDGTAVALRVDVLRPPPDPSDSEGGENPAPPPPEAEATPTS